MISKRNTPQSIALYNKFPLIVLLMSFFLLAGCNGQDIEIVSGANIAAPNQPGGLVVDVDGGEESPDEVPVETPDETPAEPSEEMTTVFDVLEQLRGRYSRFEVRLREIGLNVEFSSANDLSLISPDIASQIVDPNANLTVFVPSPGALERFYRGLSQIEQMNLLSNPDSARNLLNTYVIPEVIDADGFDGRTVTAPNGQILNLARNNGNITVNNARITEGPIMASNGVVYIIDTVLEP